TIPCTSIFCTALQSTALVHPNAQFPYRQVAARRMAANPRNGAGYDSWRCRMTLQHRAPAPNLAAIPAQLTAIALMAQAMRDMLSTGEYLPDYDKLLGRIGQHVDLH